MAVFRALLMVTTLLFSGVLSAQPQWQELSPAQRQELQRYAERWDQMPADKRERILRNHARWQNMSPEEKQRARAKWDKFRALPEAQREALRDCYRRKRKGEEVECPRP
ncbi:DUF3106 domain-containing protein [Oceanococcus atlanticus]|nr:DUF3106 domain-containing protein [Oceanococcus atlanticus]RZO84991.1 MAG: DUF3106 domain-containing protein [Oceanococcus sp.]